MEKDWWKSKVFYQIYVRSFQDSDNDGHGDLKGISRRLSYLKQLGIDVLTLSPIFNAKNDNYGYDVVDWYSIDDQLGSITELKHLIKNVHDMDMKIVLSFPINETSYRHPWFIESCKKEKNDKSDFYIWRKEIPNNWMSGFGGKAWTFNEERGEYYYHSFLPQQPDLNYYNDAVFREIEKVLRYYLEMGIDGIKLGVVNLLIKDGDCRSNPTVSKGGIWRYNRQRHVFDRNRPGSHKLLQRVRYIMDDYPDKVLIGNALVEYPGEPELSASYMGITGDELDLCLDYTLMNKAFSARNYESIAKRMYEATNEFNWPSWILSYHAQSRMISKLKDNIHKYKISTMFYMTQKGTPFLYYGEEIGLLDSKIDKEHTVDFIGKKFWPNLKGRDMSRGPMMWENKHPGYGFSKETSWLPFANMTVKKTVTEQAIRDDSLLYFYTSLIKVRKNNPALNCGEIKYIKFRDDNKLVSYLRYNDEQTFLVLLNFVSANVRIMLDRMSYKFKTYDVVFDTHGSTERNVSEKAILLDSYQGMILELH